MTDRLRKLAEFYQLSPAAFADQIGVSRPVLSHIFSERNKPSLEVIQKIGMAFPDVELDWLLYGKGEMLKNIAAPTEKNIENAVPKPSVSAERMENSENQNSDYSSINKQTEAPKYRQNSEIKKVVKIVIFYEDRSFEEFNPS